MNIQEYCLGKNFYFDDDTLYNFHCCLQTKPFTILYGPSGTGKSKIAELYAEFICSEQGLNLQEQFCFVPVRSNWTSPSDLMGFYDYLNDCFIESKFYSFLQKAECNQDKPYFLVLDEMNLSVVEHYFSDFLSCLESRRTEKLDFNHDIFGWQSENLPSKYSTLAQAIVYTYFELVESGELSIDDAFEFSKIREHKIINEWKEINYTGGANNWLPMFRTEFNNAERASIVYKFFEKIDKGVYKLRKEKNYKISDLSQDVLKKMDSAFKARITQQELEIYKNKDGTVFKEIPLNLYIIGTINMDESTHPLSSKVLDRANTIEMNNVSRDILQQQSGQNGFLKISNIDTSFSTIKSIPTLHSIKHLNTYAPDLVSLIYAINDELHQYRTNMGHRSIFEMAHYINNYVEPIDSSKHADLAIEALDFQLCQKLVPKLMGADQRVEKSIQHTIDKLTNGAIHTADNILQADVTQQKFGKTLSKLQRMYRYYDQNGFVNFANV